MSYTGYAEYGGGSSYQVCSGALGKPWVGCSGTLLWAGSEKGGGVSRGVGSAKGVLDPKAEGGRGGGTAGHAVAPFCGEEYSSADQALCIATATVEPVDIMA